MRRSGASSDQAASIGMTGETGKQAATMSMYTLENFANMFDDPVRHYAYAEALRRTVERGDVVVDVGTGNGLYAILAAQLGARKVYAIEANPLVAMGPRLAEANGVADRIEFIEAMSTEIELPEQADVVFSDLRGVVPLYGMHLPSVRDARRFLKPGGVMLPERDVLMAALVENRSADWLCRKRWVENPFAFDLTDVVEVTTNEFRTDDSRPADLVSEPVEIAAIDYLGPLDDINVGFRGPVQVTRTAKATGVCLWFEATIFGDLSYSSGPVEGRAEIYSMAYLPFDAPVAVDPDSTLELVMAAHHAVADYVWTWGLSGTDSSGTPTHRQRGTFPPIDLDRIHGRHVDAERTITGSEALQADLAVLNELAKGATLGSAAQLLRTQFAEQVDSEFGALERVMQIAGRYLAEPPGGA